MTEEPATTVSHGGWVCGDGFDALSTTLERAVVRSARG